MQVIWSLEQEIRSQHPICDADFSFGLFQRLTKVKEIFLAINVVITKTVFPLNRVTKIFVLFQIPRVLKTQVERSDKVYHVIESLERDENEVDPI